MTLTEREWRIMAERRLREFDAEMIHELCDTCGHCRICGLISQEVPKDLLEGKKRVPQLNFSVSTPDGE